MSKATVEFGVASLLCMAHILLLAVNGASQLTLPTFVILLTLYIFILSANCTIIFLILIHRNLHEPMYIFIAALSVNSVLFSTVIYPKLFIDVLSQKQTISYSACMFQYCIYNSLGPSDVLLLSAMSYDRYVSICKPLQYPNIMRKRTVIVLLTLAWFLPASQLAVGVLIMFEQKMCTFTTGGFWCNNSVHRLYCLKSTFLTVYVLIFLICIVVIPVMFILFTYIKIFQTTHQSCVEVRKKAIETCLPHLMVLICSSSLGAFDATTDRMESSLPKNRVEGGMAEGRQTAPLPQKPDQQSRPCATKASGEEPGGGGGESNASASGESGTH
ncbi:olfactory receptor 10J4-like [Nerophis ophidion]|uniref:olfactory receptor 10J4-like n=1 Tax=Nerophis ophidion TaxID=159077 RepID=UPI002AE04D8E|nr:olfactory receptor 10J4-like [Nerophis ophidion]